MTNDRFVLDRRYTSAFDSMDDAALAALAAALEGDLRDGFARLVGLPASAFDDPGTLGGLVRAGITARRAAHDAGIVLAEPCTEWAIEVLGDASENPTLEEIEAMLPAALDKFGLDAVRLMVIQYSRSLKGFRQLVAKDERFAAPVAQASVAPIAKDEAEQAAKREARKARKAAEREKKAKQQQRR